MAASIHLITVVGGHIDVLPHMLDHYRGLGIESFFVNLHLTTDRDPAREQVEDITRSFGCGIASSTIGPWGPSQQQLYAVQRTRYPDDWFVLADQDELHQFPSNLQELVAECEASRWDHVRGCFLDRIARDGGFPAVTAAPNLEEQFPLGGWISNPILHADPRKVVAVKGPLPVVRGQHFAYSRRAMPARQCFVPVHHYKWTAGLAERLRARAAHYQASGQTQWIESARFVEYFGLTGGRFQLEDPNLKIAECAAGYPHWEAIKKYALQFPLPEF